MATNFNIGLLGHVDSGKTTLARALSTCASTAAFDKNPQSQERGITLDLGFSSLLTEAPAHLKILAPEMQQMQFTFVDCPGHASLIRTIISGAQIIDLMLLVVDAQRGIQTQTAECIVIGEILQRKLIVVVNKIDMLEESQRAKKLLLLHTRLRKTLARTTFAQQGELSIFDVCAHNEADMQGLREGILRLAYIPLRQLDAPLLIYVDHCFAIKGQGTVCTGTVMQGSVTVNDTVEMPAIGLQRKIKSIQMFRRPTQHAAMGDRIGICVTQFNPKQLERGLLTAPQYLQPIYAAIICLQRIPYYKSHIKSKSKFHFTVAHKSVVGRITLFRSATAAAETIFDDTDEYEHLEQLSEDEEAPSGIFALLEFEAPIFAAPQAIIIAANFDMDVHQQQCRLAFWGHMQWCAHANNYRESELLHFRIYKWKTKQGNILRVGSDKCSVIVPNLFAKEANRAQYVGKHVTLSTGEHGIIDSTFGQTSKVKVSFVNELPAETLAKLGRRNGTSEVVVLLRMKKYIFNKKAGLIQ